jgi:hypothetical protein
VTEEDLGLHRPPTTANMSAALSRPSSCSVASSETLSADELSLQDIDTTSSTNWSSSSTIVCWTPSGLSGKILHAFGTSTVELVTQLKIKKRLSSIGSQIDVRLGNDQALSESETGRLRVAYCDLVELSS